MKREKMKTVVIMIFVCLFIAVHTYAVAGEGKGYDQGVKKKGFILKYEKHPEFIRHLDPEPGDAARWYESQVPSPEFPYEYKFTEVLGANIAYTDQGKGEPIVFIHGAPEQSYIWRNLIPYLLPYGRVITFDHIGHGLSDKPDVKYEFPDYVKYTEAFFNKMNLKNMTLIIHDWGSVIGLDYAEQSFGLVAPAADLVYRNSYDLLIEDVQSGGYAGLSTVFGVECHHLVFRGKETDWQIWIQNSETPLPRKFVITSKWLAGAPQFTAFLTDWNVSAQLEESLFTFLAPDKAEEIQFLPTEN